MCHKFQLIYYIPGELRKMLRHVILYKNYPDPTIFELVPLIQVKIVLCLIIYTLHSTRSPPYF
jgi:hypothetical protein